MTSDYTLTCIEGTNGEVCFTPYDPSIEPGSVFVLEDQAVYYDDGDASIEDVEIIVASVSHC